MPSYSELARSPLARRTGTAIAVCASALAIAKAAEAQLTPRDKNQLKAEALAWSASRAVSLMALRIGDEVHTLAVSPEIPATRRYRHHRKHRRPHHIDVKAHSAAPPLPAILRRIGGCESENSPTAPINYTAINPHSTASGGFQDLDSTWNKYEGYPRAMDAPPAVQNKFNETLYTSQGTNPWYSSESCWE